jgi:site-specific recombinase XerD
MNILFSEKALSALQHSETVVNSARRGFVVVGEPSLPMLIMDAGERVQRRFVEFFMRRTSSLDPQARGYYYCSQFFHWATAAGFTLSSIDSTAAQKYVSELTAVRSVPTVKVHLKALRKLFEFFVASGSVTSNPFKKIRFAKLINKSALTVDQDKQTASMSITEANTLLAAFDSTALHELRDRALIGMVAYSSIDALAISHLHVGDFIFNKMKCRLRSKQNQKKNDPRVDLPPAVARDVQHYVDQAKIGKQHHFPLFRKFCNRGTTLSAEPLNASDILEIVQFRLKAAIRPQSI